MAKKESGKKGKGLLKGLVSFVFVGIGGFCGAFGIEYLTGGEMDGFGFWGILGLTAIILVCLYAVLGIQIVAHEGGHLVMGLATGYTFLSFRVFNLIWVKVDGKIKLRRFSLAGTGGQCLMAPPELTDGKMPYVLYNLGGVLFNLISTILFGGLFFLCDQIRVLGFFCLMNAFAGLIYTLLNGIPMSSGGVDNDGRNIVSIGKSETALRCFRQQMLIVAGASEGKRLRELPGEWFAVPENLTPEDDVNPMVQSIRVFAFNRLMDEESFGEALTLGEALLQKKGVLGVHQMILTSELIYCELLGQNRRDVIDGYRTKEFAAFVKSMAKNPSVIRMEYAVALLRYEDETGAKKWQDAFEKTAKSYPYPREIEGERSLMAIAEMQYRARVKAEETE